MENNHDIDKTFNEASKTEEPATFPGFEKVWNTIEEKLDKKKEKKKILPVWLPYGIAASLLIGSGIFYFNNKEENTGIVKPAIAETKFEPNLPTVSVPSDIQKVDSMVKANIQNETLPPPAKIAYHHVPKSYELPKPAYEMQIQESREDAAPVVESKMMDTLKRQNIEEVITTGIRKEKASMVASSETIASSAIRKKGSALGGVADTAEVTYPNNVFDIKNQARELEILAYNKAYKAKQAIPTSNIGNKIGNNAYINSVRGAVPGVAVNSISGSGSGKADIFNSSQKPGMDPLIVINGVVADMETFRKLDSKKIKNISVISKEKASGLFSGKAQNGVVVVETKGISKEEKRKMEILLKNESPK
ncbi:MULTISPECIES: hypothetical protein [Chryseobacterium]|uniref:TonB-dependent SusC/RagA subfamily outer membrane receptor n=1 Tax=Chryseobacterium geocarposphaerae TaxID=1416776 RepID=A0ABU1LBC5_9FLAO|nr:MULTISPECIES: hypothetical protein [Chryseobacterium]MDR6404013.1 hypothetical protein [Chryseobacterium geocarposphaerae]MDR6698468.1 hypothetical protein [Chryseobacterium ginsenosidimutans]